jgi:hypothetical protein
MQRFPAFAYLYTSITRYAIDIEKRTENAGFSHPPAGTLC